MSELYLDLKRRIPVVAQWTSVPTEDMKAAQDRLGLSDERLARLLHVSTKTWSRWKRDGRVPTHDLPRLAPILGFELASPDPVLVEVARPAPDLQEALGILIELQVQSLEALQRIEQAIRGLGGSQRRAAQS